MKCEVAQNRLLALSDPSRAPEELRMHVTDCAACRAYAAGIAKLDSMLASLPVPSSDLAKATFLDRVTAAGPVITRIPTVPKRGSSIDLPALVRNGRWKYVSSGLAAGIVLTIGWFAFSGKKPTANAEPVAHKHELLNKQVQTVAALSQADTAPKRLEVWSSATDDLRSETKAVYKVAPDDDMKALTRMFAKVVNEGLLKQAERLNDQAEPSERQRLLTQTRDKLAATELETAELSKQAPPHSQKQLLKMSEIAKDGRLKLQDLLNKGA